MVMNGGVPSWPSGSLGEIGGASCCTRLRVFWVAYIAELLLEVAHDPRLREWTDDTETEANRAYWVVLPNDGELAARFALLFRSRQRICAFWRCRLSAEGRRDAE